jgi:hypothetical protein
MISPCGIKCSECSSFRRECNGCIACDGKVFWADDICPIYECVMIKNKYQNCGECEKLPCQIIYDCRDPSISIEEHENGIKERVNNLKKEVISE